MKKLLLMLLVGSISCVASTNNEPTIETIAPKTKDASYYQFKGRDTIGSHVNLLVTFMSLTGANERILEQLPSFRWKANIFNASIYTIASIIEQALTDQPLNRYFFEYIATYYLISFYHNKLFWKLANPLLKKLSPENTPKIGRTILVVSRIFLAPPINTFITTNILNAIHKYGYHLRNYITGTPSSQSKEAVAASHQTEQELAYE